MPSKNRRVLTPEDEPAFSEFLRRLGRPGCKHVVWKDSFFPRTCGALPVVVWLIHPKNIEGGVLLPFCFEHDQLCKENSK